jgi:hypothetical protein
MRGRGSDNAGAAVWQPGYRYNRAAPEDDAFEVGAINGASTNIPVGRKLRRSLVRAALPSVIRGPLCDFRLPLDVVITSSVSSLGAEFLLLLDDGTL